MVKIVTPQRECKYLETCNLKGIVINCSIWSQNNVRCIIFKLMKDVQELKDFIQEAKNNKLFQELTGSG